MVHIQLLYMENAYAPLVTALEKVFGKASDAGFGSAVFAEPTGQSSSCDEMALKHYTAFLGPKWTASEASWKSGWKKIYARTAGTKGDILTELASLSGAEAKNVTPLLTELIDDAAAAKAALAAAFNHPDVQALSIHHLGDGEAMSGIMISGCYTGGLGCSVLALMD